MSKPLRVIVGSSTEAERIAVALEAALKAHPYDFELVHWREAFPKNRTFFESLNNALDDFDFALFIAHHDDDATRRGQDILVTRDNVIFEFGLFMGALGRDRSYLVVPDGFNLTLPSDLQGVNQYTWGTRDTNANAAVRHVAMEIRDDFMRIGPRSQSGAVSIELLTRDALHTVIPGIGERFAAAREHVWVSGNDCKRVVESESAHIEAALARGVEVKMMCADPGSAPLLDMLAAIDPRFEVPEDFTDSMVAVSRKIMRLQSRFPGKFEARYLPVLPALGFFIVDPQRDGLLKVETYTPKPWGVGPMNTRPHLKIPPALTEWREYFLRSWENYWMLAAPAYAVS